MELVLVTVTQLPTATSDAETVTVWVNVVVAVQLTVTCPLVGFWTSIELVACVRAATVPDAVEKFGRGVVVVVVAAPAIPLRPSEKPDTMRATADRRRALALRLACSPGRRMGVMDIVFISLCVVWSFISQCVDRR